MNSPRIALYYDSLWVKGGAERVAAQLATGLGADLIVSGVNPKLKEWLDFDGKLIDIGNALIHKTQELGMLLEAPARFSRYQPLPDYDVHLFMGFNSIYAAKPGQKNIWFSLTPNRMLYDHRRLKTTTGSFAKRNFFKVYQQFFTPFDQSAVKNISTIIAQTKGVQERIQTYYNRVSQVIYSPVDTKRYKYISDGDFFLSVGRLVPEKRVQLIAESFAELPHKKLVMVGDGPERKQIESIAKRHPNIKYLKSVSDEKLRELYGTCLATVYLPMNEDFGLVPIEGMASGKVAIVANEGGCLETVEHNVTGKIIPATKTALQKTVNELDKAWARKQKNACIHAAKLFDLEHCIDQWERVIQSVR